MTSGPSRRNCLITGASSGIGRATARALARRGVRLWLLCRDGERGRATVDAIRDEFPGSRVELLLADLASQKEVHKAAAEFLAQGEPLHVLLHNAGLANQQRSETVDGIEATLAVNHLAPFLLTHLLRERLVESAPARVVMVSSTGHAFGRIDLDDLERTRSYSGFRQYCNSKLANVLFTYELARRLSGTGVTATCLHPGGVRSGLGMQNRNGVVKGLMTLMRPFLRTPERGAETSIYLATAPEVEGMTGEYFVDCKPRRSSSASYDLELARDVWEASERLTGLAAT